MATSTDQLVDLDFPMPPSSQPHAQEQNDTTDFLRLSIAVPAHPQQQQQQQRYQQQQPLQGGMYPPASHPMYGGPQFQPAPITAMPYGSYGRYQPANRVVAIGILHVTVVQAKLTKNYGLTRMDPFCRIILGSYDRNTAVCPNGAKEPRWNQRLSIPVPEGFKSLRLEVVDVCTFSDKLVAHADINIERALAGESYEIWTTLSGKQGEDKEGAVLVHFNFQPASSQAFGPGPGMAPGQPAPAYTPHQPQTRPPRPGVDPTIIANLKEMFPDMSEDVLKTLLETNGGNMEQTITSLLSMSNA